jgi:50S ribosomal subunit-associated GTPase HflX
MNIRIIKKFRLDVQEVGIKSARGRKAGTIGGEGETQLEMEKRRLTDREAKIGQQLEQLRVRIEHEKVKKEASHQTLPLIGLVFKTF